MAVLIIRHIQGRQSLFRVNCWSEVTLNWTRWAEHAGPEWDLNHTEGAISPPKGKNLARLPLITQINKKDLFPGSSKTPTPPHCTFSFIFTSPPVLLPVSLPHSLPPLSPHRPFNATYSTAWCWSGMSAKQLFNSAPKAVQAQCASVCGQRVRVWVCVWEQCTEKQWIFVLGYIL